MTVRCDTMFVWWFDVVSSHNKINDKILKTIKANDLFCCNNVLIKIDSKEQCN